VLHVAAPSALLEVTQSAPAAPAAVALVKTSG
jgi:hypothetical protein